MKKLLLILVPVLVVILAVFGAVKWCWNHRETTETRREARKAVMKELRETPPERVLARLEQLASEKTFQVWFVKDAEGGVLQVGGINLGLESPAEADIENS